MNNTILEDVLILDAGSEGKAVARVNDRVIFIPFVVPGDLVDVKIIRKKKSFYDGIAVRIKKYSDKRTEAFCEHFGTCGGCRWQNMQYLEQLFYKQKQVEDQFKRIGHIEDFKTLPILPSQKIKYYRNKLEYTFSNHRWLSESDRSNSAIPVHEMNALGFHIPMMFDKILDIKNCYLQADPSNDIRLEAKKYALERGLSFYDVRIWQGFLRNIVIRTTTTGEIMVIMVFRENDEAEIKGFMNHLKNKFPQITSLYYVINDKKNDVTNDLPYHFFNGKTFITEKMTSYNGDQTLEYRIGPSSFFQTNSEQAAHLYKIGGDFAEFKGDEIVYDLYTGIGTIATFISSAVKQVIGIEYVPAAVEDARINAEINHITNTTFIAGEAEKILNSSFIRKYGQPGIIITDPPRAGMHEKVVQAMLEAAPEKIVYISCNPATQARDIALMKEVYKVEKSQPVDMFPHTHHVENIALLRKI